MARANVFCTPDLLQGYWQMTLDQTAQKIFTTITARGVYTSIRVLQGVLNATCYFKGTMGNVLEGLLENNGQDWVDDIGIWAVTGRSRCNGCG